MDFKDIENIWDSSTNDKEYFTEKIKPNISIIIKQKAGDLMTKLKRKILIEIVGSLAFIAIAFTTVKTENIPLPVGVLIVAIILISLLPYYKLWSQISIVQNLEVKKSIELKISIVKEFMKSLKRYVWIFVPIGMLLGVTIILSEKYSLDNVGIEPILIILSFALPIMLLIIAALNRFYVPKVYGPTLDELVSIKNDLDEGS